MPNVTKSTISCGIKLLQNLGVYPAIAVMSLSDEEAEVTDRQTGLGTLQCHPVYTLTKKCTDPNCSMPNCTIAGRKTAAFVLFSDVAGYNGSRLARYIRENALGEVTESQKVTNPNTHREIILYTWKLPTVEKYEEFISTPKFQQEYKEAVERVYGQEGRKPHG